MLMLVCTSTEVSCRYARAHRDLSRVVAARTVHVDGAVVQDFGICYHGIQTKCAFTLTFIELETLNCMLYAADAKTLPAPALIIGN